MMITCLRGGEIYESRTVRSASVHLDEAGAVHRTHPPNDSCSAEATFDLTGGIVIPQAVDAHVHVFDGFGIGAPPDEAGWARDVDILIDGGSAGAATLPAMKRIVEQARTDVRLWLNVSAVGLVDGRVAEAANPDLVNRNEILKRVGANRERIVGFKARMSRSAVGEAGAHVMDTLDELRQATGLPSTVHIGDTALPLAAILERLHRGDVVCHCFHGRDEGILEPGGNIASCVREAASRGVLFDIAPGTSHLSNSVLRAAANHGFWPSLISTDVSRADVSNAGSRIDVVASVLLNAGMPLSLVINAITESPRAFLPDLEPNRHMLMWRRQTPETEYTVGGCRFVVDETLRLQRWQRSLKDANTSAKAHA